MCALKMAAATVATPTPLRHYPGLDALVGHGIRVHVKHENHLPTNSFKYRNGLSALTALPAADRAKGVLIDPKNMVPRAARVLGAMRVGDHWIVAFAPDQAYGMGGDPPRIGPNEALLVDIRVRETRPREAAAPALADRPRARRVRRRARAARTA